MDTRIPEVRQDQFWANERTRKRVIQHKAYKGFLQDFGLPDYKDWNP